MAMRPAKIVAGTFLIAGLAAGLYAQSPSSEAVIAVPEVEVRCGPSAVYYPTGKLRQGDKVKVREEKEGGWLAIDPPEGSFSWIESRVLRIHPGSWTADVLIEDVPVRAGSLLNDRFNEVVTTRLKQGSQVIIVGPAKVLDDGSKWWRIKPQNELRWIPSTAVNRTPLVEAAGAVNLRAPTAAVPVPPSSPEAMWQQAEQARQAGNIAEARRLYEMCLRLSGISDRLRWDCVGRLQALNTVPPGNSIAGQGNPPVPPMPVPQQGQSAYGPVPPVGGPTSTPGRLRRAPFFIDGKQAYALEDSQGRLVLYATAQTGLNLELYVGQNVTLHGALMYHGQLKKDCMRVTHVMRIP
jgi:hypothetical protein